MNRADDRCAGTARDGGPCTFTRAGHADGKPHGFVDAFDEVGRLRRELAEAKRALTEIQATGARRREGGYVTRACLNCRRAVLRPRARFYSGACRRSWREVPAR